MVAGAFDAGLRRAILPARLLIRSGRPGVGLIDNRPPCGDAGGAVLPPFDRAGQGP